MSNRFEDADITTVDIVRSVVSESFPQLINAEINVVFDNKKRKTGDAYVLGRMKKCNETEKLLSATNDRPEGFDYIMYLDRAVFMSVDDIDKIRLIRHELQHCNVDMEKENPYGIRKHEVTDFYDEIEYNKNDPRWAERLGVVADSIYNTEE